MRDQTVLLQMSGREFAQRAGIPLSHARFFVRHPHVVPRQELWKRFAFALLLDISHFERGGTAYDTKLARLRMTRYYNQGRISAERYCKACQCSGAALKSILEVCERKLMEELGIHHANSEEGV
jgi:hypothetical protein